MKAYSGILVVKKDSRLSGRAIIDFDDFPKEKSSVGDAEIHQRRQVGSHGRFNADPAYIVQIREWVSEDQTVKQGGGPIEFDHWEVNSNANKNRLEIFWRVDDRLAWEAEIREISFLVVGE